jgi:hypothetical protein
MRSRTNCLLIIACAVSAFAQVTTSRLDGTVTDPQGASVVGAEIRVLNVNTGQSFENKTDERGYGKTVDPNQPYIGPADQPGQLGQRIFLYGPTQQKWDFSLIKKTTIREKMNVEFRAQALNAFNLTNFLLFNPGNGITPTLSVNSAFGQTTGAYRDLQNTNDTGGRILEFALRFNF